MPIFFLHMLNFFFISLRAFCWANKGENWSLFSLGKLLPTSVECYLYNIYAVLFVCSFILSVICRSFRASFRALQLTWYSQWATVLGLKCCFSFWCFSIVWEAFLHNINTFNCRQFSWQTLHELRDTCQVSDAWCASSFPKSFACQVRFLSLSPAKFVS